MSLLSLISFFNAYTFAIMGFIILSRNIKETRNKVGMLSVVCYVIWTFAMTFFYDAPTMESAWAWHQAASLGWIFFCACGAHFFLVLSGTTKKFKGYIPYIILYAVPFFLFAKTLFGQESPVARGLVQSQIGWGWTYVSNIASPFYWLYVCYLFIYFGCSLYITYRWAKESGKDMFIKQSNAFILLVGVMLAIGFFTDMVLPAFMPIMPPLFAIISFFVAVSLAFIATRYKLIQIEEVASPDLILRTVMEPILLVNSDGLIEKCNQAAADLLKYDAEEILGRRISDFFHLNKDQNRFFAEMIRNKAARVDVDLIESKGNSITAAISYSKVESQLEGFMGIVISLHDVTDYKRRTRLLQKMANYDKLTDLPNRRMFLDRLEAALKGYESQNTKPALVFLDLDGFKSINDTYGHVVGDKLLVKVSEMLMAVTRQQDMIARIGGDEFILLLTDVEGEIELNRIIDRIKDLLPEPLIIDGVRCEVGISLGVSRCPEDGITAEQLMAAADERMYRDKASKGI